MSGHYSRKRPHDYDYDDQHNRPYHDRRPSKAGHQRPSTPVRFEGVPTGPRAEREKRPRRNDEDLEEGEVNVDREPHREESKSTATEDLPSIDLDLEMETKEETSLDDLLAEKRRKRAEILAKYAAEKTSTPSPAPEPGAVTTGLNSPAKRLRIDSPAAAAVPSPSSLHQTRDGTDTPDSTHGGTFALEKSADEQSVPTSATNGDGHEEEISAADYNPDEDRKLDDARQLVRAGQAVHPESPEDGASEEEVEIEVTDDEAGDAGADDDDDMFALVTTIKKESKKKKIKVKKSALGQFKKSNNGMVVIDRSQVTGGVQMDDQDDSDGYYRVILGELLDNGRYHVHANLGKGMFSSVVRAKDLKESGKEVAIKMIRSQESMFKAGQKEAGILNKLAEQDPTDKKHIIRLFRTFEHRGHLCLVFESLSMNLREVVKKYGKDVGINLKAVRAYAHQMFLGLNLMKKCNIMHADIKPDNILVNENHSVLKISDLGSASDTSENDITPYLVSRFYRAPEIILGLPYDCALDMWSIGCTLYELFTGKILFPGRNNNQMLFHIQQVKGRLGNRMIKKGKFAEYHFDEQGSFLTAEYNKSTGTESIKKMALPVKPTSDLKSRLMQPSVVKHMSADEQKMLGHFVDLLDKTLELDPAKRLTPKDALLVRVSFLRVVAVT